MEELNKTLEQDPKNLLATAYLASLYYQMKDFPKALEWNKKVVELDPKDKAALYTLGVIPWTQFIAPDREARLNEKMKPEDPGPLKDPKERAALKEKYWQSLTDGIEYEKKALAVNPEYENAMAYMNLLIRYRADLLEYEGRVPGRHQGSGHVGAEVPRNHQDQGRAESFANPNAK